VDAAEMPGAEAAIRAAIKRNLFFSRIIVNTKPFKTTAHTDFLNWLKVVACF
jgi:hypothetical protein